MSPMPSTQQSPVRPHNRYRPSQNNNSQSHTPAINRNKPKLTKIPPKSTLYDWIKPKLRIETQSTTQTPAETGNKQRPTRSTTPLTQPQRRHTHQQTISPTQTNNQWGDELCTLPQVFRVASLNVNTLSPDDNFIQWRGVANAMKTYRINSLCIQETNLKWTDYLHHRVQRIFQQTFRRSALSTSNSTEPADHNYQPGGTALHLVGSHATRLIGSGQDTSGMGQWSFLELLGKNNKRLIIASVYCVCAQTAHIGSNTIITQQTQILIRSGQHRPKPRDQLINDLIDQIQQWQQTGHEILVCLDANEDTANPSPEIGYGKLLHSTGLIDLHRY